VHIRLGDSPVRNLNYPPFLFRLGVRPLRSADRRPAGTLLLPSTPPGPILRVGIMIAPGYCCAIIMPLLLPPLASLPELWVFLNFSSVPARRFMAISRSSCSESRTDRTLRSNVHSVARSLGYQLHFRAWCSVGSAKSLSTTRRSASGHRPPGERPCLGRGLHLLLHGGRLGECGRLGAAAT